MRLHWKDIRQSFWRYDLKQLRFLSRVSQTCCFYLMMSGFLEMMLGSKGLFPPTDAYELLRCKAAPAILHHGILAIT